MSKDSLAYERRKAVAEAWKNEKNLVSVGKGTRDWDSKEQREILLKGKASGYQGHHMKSVDGHNSKAGDPNNIQFLTRKEHLAAHNGDFHNNTNGYYDPTTGKMHGFGRNRAHVDPFNLNNPLSGSEVKAHFSKTEMGKKTDDAKTKAESFERRTVNKTKNSKSISYKDEQSKSKTLAAQRSSKPNYSSNKNSTSKTLSAQRENNSYKSSSKTLNKQRNKESLKTQSISKNEKNNRTTATGNAKSPFGCDSNKGKGHRY